MQNLSTSWLLWPSNTQSLRNTEILCIEIYKVTSILMMLIIQWFENSFSITKSHDNVMPTFFYSNLFQLLSMFRKHIIAIWKQRRKLCGYRPSVFKKHGHALGGLIVVIICWICKIIWYVDGLMQNRHNSTNALLRLFYIKQSIIKNFLSDICLILSQYAVTCEYISLTSIWRYPLSIHTSLYFLGLL